MSASAPSPPSTITEVNELNGDIGADRTERDSKGSVPGNGGHFVFTEDDERKFAEKMDRDLDIANEAVDGVHDVLIHRKYAESQFGCISRGRYAQVIWISVLCVSNSSLCN